MVEGPVLVAEAMRAGWDIVECFVSEDSEFSADVPMFELEERVLASVTDAKTTQGVAAVVSMTPPWGQGTGSRDNEDRSDWVLVADGISDPGNLGTIMRSAEAAGAAGIFLVNDTVDPFSPKTVRSSAGALFHVPVRAATYGDLASNEYQILGMTSHESVGGVRSVSMYEVSVAGRIAVVVGSESHGISVDAPIDKWVMIPHRGRAESLNAAMAATVMCMYVDHARDENVPRSTRHLH